MQMQMETGLILRLNFFNRRSGERGEHKEELRLGGGSELFMVILRLGLVSMPPLRFAGSWLTRDMGALKRGLGVYGS